MPIIGEILGNVAAGVITNEAIGYMNGQRGLSSNQAKAVNLAQGFINKLLPKYAKQVKAINKLNMKKLSNEQFLQENFNRFDPTAFDANKAYYNQYLVTNNKLDGQINKYQNAANKIMKQIKVNQNLVKAIENPYSTLNLDGRKLSKMGINAGNIEYNIGGK